MKRKFPAALLAAPMAWLIVAYLGALAMILVTSFWSTNEFDQTIVHTFTLDNFRTMFTGTYLSIIGRTIGVAFTVTILCAFIAVPLGFLMARVVPLRFRGIAVALVLVPLWASYLVKAYAWRAMLQPGGLLQDTLGFNPGYGLVAVVITLTYLWLPYMILPVYSAFERLPESHLEASSDLGAPMGTTVRRIILPALWPAIAAGSIFTFSLSLGDYIAVSIVGGTQQMLGTAVLANNQIDLPFAATLGTASVVIMVGYLIAMRRTGAMENL